METIPIQIDGFFRLFERHVIHLGKSLRTRTVSAAKNEGLDFVPELRVLLFQNSLFL
jgi:hypothetical protein